MQRLLIFLLRAQSDGATKEKTSGHFPSDGGGGFCMVDNGTRQVIFGDSRQIGLDRMRHRKRGLRQSYSSLGGTMQPGAKMSGVSKA